jgi:hypothetical protein
MFVVVIVIGLTALIASICVVVVTGSRQHAGHN